MFFGTHICGLDEKGQFTIPKPYRELLDQAAEDDNTLCFAATKTLRVYTQAGARDCMKMLNELSHGCTKVSIVRNMMCITGKYGLVKYSHSGLVAIPQIFLNIYRLSPKKKITLEGMGVYFQIT